LASKSLARRFARNLKWQFVANGSQALFGGAYLLLLGRYLGAAEFGVFSIITAVISVAALFLEFRIQDVVAKNYSDVLDFSENSQNHGSNLIDLLGLELLSRLLPVTCLIVLSPQIAKYSNLNTEVYSMIILAALSFLVGKTGVGVSTGLLRVLGRTDLIAAFMTADWGLRLLFSLILVLSDSLSVANALWVALFVGAACNIIQLSLAFKEYQLRVTKLNFKGWRLIDALVRLRRDKRLLLSSLGISASDVMAKDLDIALISTAMSVEKVGVYKMAKSFVQIIWRGIDPFYLAIMPEIQRHWVAKNIVELKVLIKKTSVRLMLLSLILCLSGYVLLLLFGLRILGPGYDQVPQLVLFMSIWIIVCAPIVWGHPLTVAINRPELALVGSLLGSAIGIIAFLFFTPRFGLMGAAGAWVLTLSSGFLFIATSSVFTIRKRLFAH
jgi:O-antigen/teichoic acid export membrane protein